MPSRRHFLQTLAALPPALALSRASASGDASRIGLIIGNNAYREAPLTNPANDARDFGALLDIAGFSVERHINLGRQDMVAAIERFGKAVARSETKLAVFYYAGHGVQLDWRNYLLPVDAAVDTADQLKQRCVDLGLLLGTLSGHKDKTFVIILDACRDDPFAGTYRPAQKGLSQFDAPVGSLLAYATSPGNVASDGSGKNGLYTEHLLRELSQRGTRLEDALKRVRLSVRLGSKGAQIPWETTSLENDVFIFPNASARLSEEEIEKQLEADIAEWSRVKHSKDLNDWVGYLRKFPNGRFAEIAQVRVTKILADVEKEASLARARQEEALRLAEERRREAEMAKQRPSVPAVPNPHATASPLTAAPPTQPVSTPPPKKEPYHPDPSSQGIEVHAGKPVPAILPPSSNPFAKGRFQLGRIFTLGDQATFRQSDILTGVEERIYSPRVTRVDIEHDRVEFNNGFMITDLMGNSIKTGPVEFDTPVQFHPAEFYVGKKWTAAFRRTQKNRTTNAYYDLRIVGREFVDVPAGRFDTFRIEGFGWNTTDSTKLETVYWLVPGLVFGIKREFVTRNRWGRYGQTERHELISLRQHAVGQI